MALLRLQKVLLEDSSVGQGRIGINTNTASRSLAIPTRLVTPPPFPSSLYLGTGKFVVGMWAIDSKLIILWYKEPIAPTSQGRILCCPSAPVEYSC